MRIAGTLLLGCLCVLTPRVRAQEGPDAATVHIPKTSPICVRIPSPDRMEEIRKDLGPIIAAFDYTEELAEKPIIDVLAAEVGIDPGWIDTSKPLYLGLGPGEDEVLVLHAGEGVAWEGVKDVKMGYQAVCRGSCVVVGKASDLEAETRGTPTELLPGDVVLHVYVDELVDRNREGIEAGFQEMGQQVAFAPMLPPFVLALVEPLFTMAKGVVYGVGPFTYAFTWKGDHAISEGYLATRPGSGLRTFFTGAGTASANDLAGFLPGDAFVTMDFTASPGWPGAQIEKLAENTFGEGVGTVIRQLMGPGQLLADRLTGRVASATKMQGMMGGSTVGIYELKEGVDATTLFQDVSFETANQAFQKLQVPLSISFEKDVTKHGEIAVHRWSLQATDPQLAMFTMMMQYYYAAEGRYLFMAQGLTGEAEIKSLIDNVHAGVRKETPHTKAMARLGGERTLGITFNFGSLKPMLPMFVMGNPEAMEFIAIVPDELYTSTAVTVTRDGNLRWKGDWPAKEVMKMIEAVKKAEEKAKAPPKDEEFD